MKKSSLMLLICLGLCAAAQAQGVQALDFLRGSWLRMSADGSRGQMERWHYDKTGQYWYGVAYTIHGRDTTRTEVMRMADVEGTLVFIALIPNQAPVLFALKERGPAGEFIFENTEHDFPQRVAYWRKGNELLAYIEGKGKDGQMKRMNFSYAYQGQ